MTATNLIIRTKSVTLLDFVNDIRNNRISEIDAKKDLNALNKIKNVEIIK